MTSPEFCMFCLLPSRSFKIPTKQGPISKHPKKGNNVILIRVQVLRSPKEAFAAAMQSWRERCEKCVCLQGDYVEK